MSFRYRSHKGQLTIGLLALLAVSLISGSAFAQSDSNPPKWDLFAGYQWLHPGGTVPTPFSNYFNPTPYKVPDMSAGFGAAVTYNFDRPLGRRSGLRSELGKQQL